MRFIKQVLFFTTFTFVAQASPPGPALGGLVFGAPLPSGFEHTITDIYTNTNSWCKFTSLAGVPGRLDVTTCKGNVQDVVFWATTNEYDQNIFHKSLEAAKWELALGDKNCEMGSVCFSTWKKGTRNISVYKIEVNGEIHPALYEFSDVPCTEGL